MAALKAADCEASRSYDYWYVTFGIGAKLNLPRGRSLYLTSNEIMKAGKYRIIDRNSRNVIMPMEKIPPPKSLDLDMVKSIVQTFCKPKFKTKIKVRFKKTVEAQINELCMTFEGLFDETLKTGILRSQPNYHVPGLMRSNLFKNWVDRTLHASKLDPLQISEDKKNDAAELRFFLDNWLSEIATETFSAISKGVVYKALWNAPYECLDYISELMKGVRFYGPSQKFEKELDELMILFGIRRWMICYVRSLISNRKDSMERYKQKYEQLFESAERKGVPISELHERFFGGYA